MKLENGLLPLRKEGSSTHNVLEGQEIASQTGSFMHNVPRIEEQFQDSVLQQPMRKPRRQSKHSLLQISLFLVQLFFRKIILAGAFIICTKLVE